MNKRPMVIPFWLSLIIILNLMIGIAAIPIGIQNSHAGVLNATNTLRVNAGSFPDTLDPQKATNINEIGHLQLIYEGLTRLDTNLNAVPAAAESWEYNSTATELTFYLRSGLKYSDGSILNAKRFEYSIFRNADPATGGEYAAITDDIAGAKEWRYAVNPTPEELAALRAGVQVRALDLGGNPCTSYEQVECRVLRIGLANPAPYFHTVMSLWVTYPAKEELINQGGDIWWISSIFQKGNGPFVLNNLEHSVRSYFFPNPQYWRGTATYNIEYKYILDEIEALSAYQNNELDVIPVTAGIMSIINSNPTLQSQFNTYNGSCTYAVMYHHLKKPFDNQKVREAFSYSINRQAWVDEVLGSFGAPTLTWIPEGFPGYDASETRWGYNPDAARQALTDGGYTVVGGQLLDPGQQPIPIVDTFSDTPRNRIRHEWLVAKWEEVLGINITLNPVESTVYTELTKNLATAPPIYIQGWCGDYPDPQNWLSVYWKTGAFGSRIGYSNPALDALLAQADSTIDAITRLNLYADAQRLLISGAPATFLWNNINAFLVKPRVFGEIETPQDYIFPGIIDPLTITFDDKLIFLPFIKR